MLEIAIANASSSILPKMIKTTVCMIGKQSIERATKEALDKAFERRTALTSPNLPRIEQALFALSLSTEESDALEEFFRSQTFGSLVRTIGLIEGAYAKDDPHGQAVLDDFITSVLPGKPPGAISSFASEILLFLRASAGDAWRIALELGIVGQSWSAESAIQAAVADEVTNARNQLGLRVASLSASFKEIDTFVDRYKSATLLATSTLRPQSVNESPSVPIGDLYVEPFVQADTEKGAKKCAREMLFAASRRSVLLGNPGGGKSTLAAKLCHDVCSNGIADDLFDVPHLAIQIVLRDYAEHVKHHPCSIIEYLEVHSRSEFQIDPPGDAFKFVLMSGRVLVIFDGLDELLEIKDRSKVCSAVEQFAREYPVAAVIVTSREVGYEQAPLDRSRFHHYKLNPFDDDQVSCYATKWFRHFCAPNLEEGRRLGESFFAESEIVPDIRSNPLMLSLLCNLYRQDGFIPNNRPEIYQRCADLLFTKWDRGRGIHVKLPLFHRLKFAMSYLAHWIYSDNTLQSGVTEARLVAKTTDYLRRWVEDDAEAQSFAQEFVSFFKGRAWVFTDTGADKTQSLYQFTHRTFLEYFTADELVRLHSSPEDLHTNLIPRIRSRSWDVVCQLAYQISVQRTPSDDTLLGLLCKDARKGHLHERLNILSFTSRTMDPLYPMPPARREAVALCIETVIENISGIEAKGENLRMLALETLGGIFNTSDESLQVNASETIKTLAQVIQSGKMAKDDLSNVLLVSSELATIGNYLRHGETFGGARYEFWNGQLENLLAVVGTTLAELALSDPTVAYLQWQRMEVGTAALVQRLGPSVLFKPNSMPLMGFVRGPIVFTLAYDTLSPDLKLETGEPVSSPVRKAWIQDEISSLPQVLMGCEPWLESDEDKDADTFLEILLTMQQRDEKPSWPKSGNARDGLLLILAFMSDLEQPITSQRFKETEGVARELVSLCFGRHVPEFKAEAEAMLELRCTSESVKKRLRNWIEGSAALAREVARPLL